MGNNCLTEVIRYSEPQHLQNSLLLDLVSGSGRNMGGRHVRLHPQHHQLGPGLVADG